MHKLTNAKTKRTGFIILFTALPVLLMIVFSFYPALKLLIYSFTDYDGLTAKPAFVGLYNWKKLFGDVENFKTLGHSLYYMAGGVVQNALALLFAVILCNGKIKGKFLFRAIIVMPFVLNGTAVSYMFRYLYDFTKGPLNIFLNWVGLEPISWLGTESIVNWCLAFVHLWRMTGYLMIIYIAALQSIPHEYYEAATLDGAGAWAKFRYITFPQILPIIGLQMFLNISGSINVFDTPFVLTGGGPNGASRTFAMKTVETAFTFHNYGLASALGLFCAVAVAVIYISQNKLLEQKGDE